MIRLVLILFFMSSCSLSSAPTKVISSTDSTTVSEQNYVKIGPSTVRFDKSLEQIPPIEVDVSQAFFNEDKLNVKVGLKTLKDFNSDEILIGILGLKQGDVVEQNFKRLKDVISTQKVNSNSKVAVRFELQSNDLTEYQITCSWGSKAKQQWAKVNQLNTDLGLNTNSNTNKLSPVNSSTENFTTNSNLIPTTNVPVVSNSLNNSVANSPVANNIVANNTVVNNPVVDVPTTNIPVAKARNLNNETNEYSRAMIANPEIAGFPGLKSSTGALELQELDIIKTEQKCYQPPCDISYTVAGSFFNGTSKHVTSANLAIGLYWVNEGQLPNLPSVGSLLNPNEELVTVQLDLEALETREFSIKLDKQIPQISGGGFVPHVRLVNPSIIKESIR